MSYDPSSPPEDGASELSDEQRHELLAESRQRQVLEALVEADGNVLDFEEVVTAVLDGEEGEIPTDRRRSVEISLRHSHLPRMAQKEVVEFDHSTGTVYYDGDERLERLLEV